MELRIHKWFTRLFGWLFFAMLAVAFLITLYAVAIGRISCLGILLALGFLLFGMALGGFVLYMTPVLRLTEDGVYAKICLVTRFYEWKEIQQAGATTIQGRGIPADIILLLLPKGTKRKHWDPGFQIRNLGRLLYVPDNENIRKYVTSHYGPLDFDLTDRGVTQSIVIE